VVEWMGDFLGMSEIFFWDGVRFLLWKELGDSGEKIATAACVFGAVRKSGLMRFEWYHCHPATAGI
jgi:hypothetical protein